MSNTAFREAVDAIAADQITVSDAAKELYANLHDTEKLGLLDGDGTPISWIMDTITGGYCGKPVVASSVRRLGIPGIRFSDGPRGLNRGTAFPAPSQRANTFNVELEEEIVSTFYTPCPVFLLCRWTTDDWRVA
jgi:beta-glucosidase